MRWLIALALSSVSWGACTPATGYSFCTTLTQVHTQNGGSNTTNFPVGIIGTANGTGTGAFSSTNVDLRTVANGGKIQNTIPIGGVLSGIFKSVGAAVLVCTAGQTITLSSFNGGGSSAAATVACTGVNTIAASTALIFSNIGSGYTSDPSTATCGNGTGACSGTVNVDVLFATFVSPADLRVTSDSLGATVIPFEVASYTATTGAIEIYAEMNISHTADTLFYMSYGNASVTVSPNDIVHTWNAGYAMVNHMSSVAITAGKVTQVLDSTLNDNYPTNGGSTYTQVAGVAGNGILAHDSSSSLTVATTVGFPVGAGARQVEFWINTANTKLPNGVNEMGGFGTGNTIDRYWGFYGSDNTYSTRNTLVLELFSDDGVPGTDFPQDSNWHHICTIYPSGQTQVQQGLMYMDGAANTLTFTHPTNTLNTGGGSQTHAALGRNPDGGTVIGQFTYDEWRVQNVAGSADTCLQSYNNLHAAGSFVTATNASSATPPPPFGIINQ